MRKVRGASWTGGRVRALRGIVAIAVAAALAAPSIGFADTSDPDQRRSSIEERLHELRDNIESSQTEEQSLDAEIAAANVEIAGVQARLEEVGAQVATLESELARARDQLARVESRLRDQTEQLALLRRQLAVAHDRLAARVVEIYTSPQPDLVSVVLGADNLEGLIDEIELYNQLLEQDSELIDDVSGLREEVAAARSRTQTLRAEQARATAALARRTDERRRAYAVLAAERERLGSLRGDREQSLASLVVDRKAWETEARQLEEESRQLSALLESTASQPTSGASSEAAHPTPPTGAASAAGFVWPVQGTITSPYGMRWGRLHAGLDVAAPGGTPVSAAAAGTVAYAGSMGGYGILVVVEHGNGLATAYAHNSSATVSVGQQVAQGQTIATVGCTGSCTGDHVHFEVRAGGSPVDPLGYL